MGPIREIAPWLFTYTFNYGTMLVEDNGVFFYLWSLSVEEQFYLVWPIIAITLRRKPRSLFVVTGSIVVVGYSQLTFNLFPGLSLFNYTGLLNRMGSLGLGALGALIEFKFPIAERWLKSALLEILVLLLLVFVLVCHSPYRFPLMGLCSLLLVIKASRSSFRLRPLAAFLEDRRVVYIGAISYGLYLFHIPIGVFVTKWIFDPVWMRIPFERFGVFEVLRWHSWLVKLPLISLATAVVAALSFRFVEKPILSLKDRWFPYRKQAPLDLVVRDSSPIR